MKHYQSLEWPISSDAHLFAFIVCVSPGDFIDYDLNDLLFVCIFSDSDVVLAVFRLLRAPVARRLPPPPMHSFVRLLLFVYFYNRTRRKKVFGYFIRLHFLFARSLFTIMYSVLYSVNFCFSCLSWTSILARRTGTNVFFTFFGVWIREYMCVCICL